jgi:hypothetical protein
LEDSIAADATGPYQGGCSFLQRFKQRKPIEYEAYGFKEPVWDIEDLIQSFKKKRVSFHPFYYKQNKT